MKKLFTLFSALLLWQSVTVAQNYLHIWMADSIKKVRMAELDSITVRDAEFYRLQFTPEGLNGLCYTGEVADALGRGTFTFNIKLVMSEGDTMYIYNLDPYFAQYGYVASTGANILQGKLTTAEDNLSATLSCPSGQFIGYGNAKFINLEDSSQPITFTITENAFTCDGGYGVYDEGYWSAFYPFTLTLDGFSNASQKAQQVREMETPLHCPMLKAKTMKLEHNSQQEGKVSNMQLQPMTTREVIQ